MTRNAAIQKLADRADAIRTRGATALYLFGSTQRDEARDTSDLDLFVDIDPKVKFSLIDLAGIKLYLERELDILVDVTTRDSLHPLIRADIKREALRVF